MINTGINDRSLMESGGIFVSYRQCDGSGNPLAHALFVEHLSHELADHFGDRNVFINTSMNTTAGYPDELRNRIATCDVLLVVIHPEWIADLRERLDELADGEIEPVYYEINAALNGTLCSLNSKARHPEVIPILLEEANQPKPTELPEDLRELALLQAFRLRFGSLAADLIRLRTELEIHTVPHWASVPVPVSEPKPQIQQRRDFRSAAPGRTASRSLIVAAATIGLLIHSPTTIQQVTSTTFLLLSSASIIAETLLAAAVVTIFNRSIYRMERDIHSLPTLWILIVRLVLIVLIIILLVQLTAEPDQQFFPLLPLAIGWPGGIILIFCVYAVTVREIQEDNGWPARVTTRPRTLRRTMMRLDHHLTFLWQPPLSRMQREQARFIIQQLDNALAITRTMAEGTRTRRNWIRYGWPKLAALYTAWLVGTLGLAVSSTYESSIRGDYLGWYLSIPIGVISCGLGIAAVELIYRNDRKGLNWFIEEIELSTKTMRATNKHPRWEPREGRPS